MPRILGDHWDLGGSLYTINRFSDQYKKGLHYDYAQEKKNEVNLLKSTDFSHENNDRVFSTTILVVRVSYYHFSSR